MPSIHYPTVGAVVLAFAAAAILARLANVVIHRALSALDFISAENRTVVSGRARQLTRALTAVAYSVAALASISLALERFGIHEPSWNPRRFVRWGETHGVHLVLTIVGAFIVVRAANLAIEYLQVRLSRRHATGDPEWQRRSTTLGGILTSVVHVTVGFVATLMALGELSVDVMPILTGAGIAGLAVGFGAQNLVRDVISGFFLILEDQVRVGDLARINGAAGTVEQINLRTIIMRDAEGAVHVFPNGTITALANLSKQFSYAVVDIRVPYTENVDRAIGALREVGESMAKDPAWAPLLLAPMDAPSLESMAGGGTTVRIRCKTPPLRHGTVASELRRRILVAFVDRGIRLSGR
ncbi:MAG: mechanosensitive ion channel family protein [Acidobacteria bacterium]|nr:mechanosensitive ion channel family protein [Acidobacteriota bacterium]